MRAKIISFFIFSVLMFSGFLASAQCAMCTKTAQQLGEKPAIGLNSGILYLMLVPFGIIGTIGYYWWKRYRSSETNE